MSTTPGAAPGAQVLLVARYRLERLIGRGGMAEVWAARDQVLDRAVAVKLLSSRFREDSQFQQRFRREAQAAANLNHPNIVQVYDTGEHEGLPFIVMELVRGRSLQEIVERGGLTEERALEVCAEVCAALAYAHDRGLVHRDVKPGNILIADDGTVKVTDFGIARAIDSDTVTQTAAVLGTAAYLSPEQAQGFAVDHRSDVYSLGIVLYELLTHRQPFRGDSAVGVAYQHVQEDPVAPRQLEPSVSPAAEAIAMKAMAKNAGNRYADARDMRDDLLRARAGETVAAPAVLLPDETAVLERELMGNRPPPTRQQVRRRRTTGYVVLALLSVGAVALIVWLLSSMLGGETQVTRAVPSVIGQTFEEARQHLEARGLEVEFGGTEHSRTIEEDRVMRQDPDAGTSIPDGSRVTLWVSDGPAPVAVPEVSGMEEEDAIAALRDADLVVGERRKEFSDEVERGRVIGTDPPEGEQVDEGSTVALIISAGEETAFVPDVVNLTESEARFRLTERGFTVPKRLPSEYSDTVEEGKVIRQDPAANSEVAVGSEVVIVISAGPQDPPSPSPSPSPEPSASPSDEPSPSGSPSDGPSVGVTVGPPAEDDEPSA